MALPLALCTMAHSAEQASRVLPLQNAGFEEQLNGWAATPAFKDQVSIENSITRTGNNALKIDATVQNNTPFVTSSINTSGGAIYKFSVWARVAPGAPAVSAAVKMESYSATTNNGGWYSYANLPADGSWKQITVEHLIPADSVRCSLLLRVFGQSTVIFDDAEFTQVTNSPDVAVMSPTETIVTPDKAQQLSYLLSVRELLNTTDLPQVTAHVKPFAGNQQNEKSHSIPATVTRNANSQQYNATLTLPALAATDYTVDFELNALGKSLKTTYPAYIFTTVANRQPNNLTANGNILWQGKPFFPIGMYHVPTEADYKLLAENGFNAVQGTASHDLDIFKTRLDWAQKYGLAVDVPLYLNAKVKENLPNSLEKVQRFAAHPAVLSWKIFDEPHIKADGGPATEIPATYRALKAADPNRPIELTLNSTATQQFWSHFCDIVQPDCYPLPRFPLTLVSDMAGNAGKLIQPWQNMSFVLQCGWVPDLSNQPTPAQARSMAYLALINGAKGIWWYSMYDPGWNLTKTPLWPHLKTINAEIQQLSQPIMLGKTVTGITGSSDKLHFHAFEHEKKTYLLVTNPHDEAIQGTLTLPQRFGSWRLLNSPAAKPITDHQLTISFAGVDSQTYILEE